MGSYGTWGDLARGELGRVCAGVPANFTKLTAALEETLKRLGRVRLVALYTGSGYAGWT